MRERERESMIESGCEAMRFNTQITAYLVLKYTGTNSTFPYDVSVCMCVVCLYVSAGLFFNMPGTNFFFCLHLQSLCRFYVICIYPCVGLSVFVCLSVCALVSLWVSGLTVCVPHNTGCTLPLSTYKLYQVASTLSK